LTVSGTAIDAPQLDFRVDGVEAVEHAVTPTLCFRLGIDAGGSEIRSLALNVQVRIDAPRRAHDDGERERLFELFGMPSDWGRTLRSLRWTTTSLTVPAFHGATTADVPVPCTYDFDVAATKYLHALGDGDVPLELLFSGTVFFGGAAGRLQVVHLPWDREARCAMPVRVWRDAVDRAFPGTAWLRVRRDVFDRLQAYKSSRALLTWDAALEQLLEGGE
jgi:Family of unknown function (DUF6084)